MKRILLLVLLCAICSIGYAQKIVSDEVDGDGMRIITCEEISVNPTFKLGLTSFRYKSMGGLRLMVFSFKTSDFTVRKDMKLLLKTINDEIITLESCETFSALRDRIKTDDGNVIVGYVNVSLYTMTEETIKKISKGIKKIRQETTDGLIDVEIDDVTIGSMLKQDFDLMEQAFKTPKSIYSDF